MAKVLKIGHRGAKGLAAENTLASFQKALDWKVDGIELDVHLSLDGQIVVMHDETIDRTTNGTGAVNALSLSELKAFRIEQQHQIPTLAEVFDLVKRRVFINIELKGEGTAQPVAALIKNYVLEKGWTYPDFIVSSFDWNALKEVKRLDPKIRIGVLTSTDLDLAVDFAEFIAAYAIHPYFHLLTKENTRRLQEKGFKILAWTVNEVEDIQKIKSFKTNGIMTDFPNKI